MSLLMQALKKAEHAKQKQRGVSEDDAPAERGNARAPDDALSLSPKEAIAESIPEDSTDSCANPDQANSVTLQSPLSLFPQSAEMIDSRPPVSPDLASPPIAQREYQAASPAAFGSAEAENKDAHTAANAARDSRVSTGIAGTNLSRQSMPKAGAEQKQAATQTEQTISSAQQKARSVFASKAPPHSRRNMLIAAVVLTILVVQAGLGYIYWQSTNNVTGAAVLNVPRATLPTATSPVVAPDATSVIAEASAQATTAGKVLLATTPEVLPQVTITAPLATAAATAPKSATPVVVDPKKIPDQTAAGNTTPSDSLAPGKATATLPRAQAAQAPQATQAARPPDSNAIQIRQTNSDNQINPALSSAYQLFTSGDSAAAKQQYQKVLQQEPANRDALLGMAAIALNRRQAAQAGSFYGKLLELDPADPEAIAGLTSLQRGDPVQSESRLKKILAQNPQSGAVLFALGNLYAQQSRWPDAQQTYFRAYTSAPANADYAFNLAVSLDRLSQPRLAQEYYQRALVLGQTGPGNFSRSGVQKRIRELETPADD